MAGYPHDHGYGGYGHRPMTAQPYGGPPYAPTSASVSAAPSAPPVPGEKPLKEGKHQLAQAYDYSFYATPSVPSFPAEKPPTEGKYKQSQPYASYPYAAPPPPSGASLPYGAPPSYGSPFPGLMHSSFPPDMDPNVVACFQAADQDGSGVIDDKELQRALSSYDQSFSLRTVQLLMFSFTGTNIKRIGPKDFTSLFYGLQSWRAIFERFDRDHSWKIDVHELREALLSLGYAVCPSILDLLVSKYDRSGGRNKAIEYDNFIECCLIVKGLTEKFKEKDTNYSGSATFTYEAFMLAILPFVIAG